MLEDFIIPAAAEQLRSSVLGEHVEAFCARLAELGYRPTSIRDKLRTVSVLARWIADRGHAITDLDEAYVGEFLVARRARGRTCRGLRRTGLALLEHLRCAGAIATPEAACDESPLAAVLAQYEVYLRQERAVTEGTISEYGSIAHTFVSERLPEAGARPASLDVEDVHEFLLARVRRVAPKRAQYLGSALRSFLRFLFARGETPTDLALAVLTVRQRRGSGVPRHMPPRDVERLLRFCDRSSAMGRRNHAILLLLARLGLRAGEVVALELGDLRWREGEIVVRGKGLIRDRLPLLPDVGEALARYLKTDRPAGASRRVFLCRQAPYRGLGHPSTVSTIVMRALGRAGLAPATRGAHLLRHSLATAMVRRGASLAEIGQVLRHHSPNTTEIYAKLDFGALRDIALPWPTFRGAR
jgi:site-specific recombinase XerD